MGTGVCSKCDGKMEIAYRCNYCGDIHCSEHRLPEGHNCDGVKFLSAQGKRFRSKFSDEVVTTSEEIDSPEPMDSENIETYSSKEADWSDGKSPPVKLNDEDSERESKAGLLERLFNLFT